MNLGFLASHRGSNMQALVDAARDGRLHASPRVVISNNGDAEALARARRDGIPAHHLSSKTHPDPAQLDEAIRDTLVSHDVDLVILAGYLKKLGPKTLARYKGRVINVHPALLPRYGGTGMYGGRVHEAVLAAGEKESGVTIHVVDEEYDHGQILAQCCVTVMERDSVASLAQRVLEREHRFLVEVVEQIATGALKLT